MNSFLSSAEQFWLGGAKASLHPLWLRYWEGEPFSKQVSIHFTLENLKQLFNQTGSVCILTFLPHFLD
jgi:hypothetical protein